MVKKDIVLDIKAPINKEDQQEPTQINDENMSEVDKVFAAADTEMYAQAVAARSKPKKKKKKKRSLIARILTKVCVSIFVIIAVIALIIWGAISMWKSQYPIVKEQMLTEYQSMQDYLNSIDESQLTEEEVFQKRILTLLDKEDLLRALESLEDPKEIYEFLSTGDGDIIRKALPPEKVAEYEKILAEYEEWKKTQEIANDTMSTLPPAESEDDANPTIDSTQPTDLN